MSYDESSMAALMAEDPREAKQPVWVQQKLKDARRLVSRFADQRQEALLAKPADAASDMWLEVGGHNVFVGLGTRSCVRIPVGTQLDAEGMPRDYIEVEAGREHTYGKAAREPQPITHARVSGSDGIVVSPYAGNVIHAYPKRWA